MPKRAVNDMTCFFVVACQIIWLLCSLAGRTPGYQAFDCIYGACLQISSTISKIFFLAAVEDDEGDEGGNAINIISSSNKNK